MSLNINKIKDMDTFKSNIQETYKLHHITENLINTTTVDIYTDGSLSKWKGKPKMGFGWIIETEDKTQHQFQGQITQHASSSRAEIMAILTAISTVPHSCTVQIFTDSQVAINSITATINQPTSTTFKKLKNYHLLQQISEIITNKKLTVNLVKVKAHSGIPLNEKADQLANINPHLKGMDPDTHLIEINPQCNLHIPIHTKWDKLTCDIPIKEICKKISETKQLTHWRLLNRTKALFHNRDLANTHWQATFQCLHSNINSPTHHQLINNKDASISNYGMVNFQPNSNSSPENLTCTRTINAQHATKSRTILIPLFVLTTKLT